MFRKDVVSKNFMYNRGYHVFLSKVLGLTVPENFAGIPSIFQNVWGNRNIICIIESMTYFRQNFSFSQSRNISWASLQYFKKFRASKNFMHITGITNLCRKNTVSQYRKVSWASLQGFRKFGISKNFIHNRGYHVFLSKNFCLTLPTNFVNESYYFWEKFSFRKVFTYEKGKYHIFLSENFGLTEPNKFVSIPAMLQKNWGFGKFYV